MQTDLLWTELLGILQQLGIDLRWSHGEFQGGLYCSRGERRVLLNEGHSREWQIRVLCRELAQLDLSEFYLTPVLRRSIGAGPESDDDPSDNGCSGMAMTNEIGTD